MTPLQFELQYHAEWDELAGSLARLRGESPAKSDAAIHGERIASLYRRACEHIALARARAYPAHIVDRLERLTANAHQLIYQRREFGVARLKKLAALDFPAAVRAHAAYVGIAAAVFCLPMVVLGLTVYARPEMILSVLDPETAAEFEHMYSGTAESIGRLRTAENDWVMFGFYIRNNIGVAFQC